MPPRARTIIVIGGGLTGLVAARRCALDSAPDTRVMLLEASDRLGGKVTTIDIDGARLDAGPEAIVTYQSAAMSLCSELKLDDLLVAPAVTRALLFTRGRLRPLPERLMRGAPGQSLRVMRAGVLSPAGFVRAALDSLLPASPVTTPTSIGDLVAPRIGRDATNRLVDPLLGNIHGGSVWNLDAELLAPQLVTARHTNRSLIRGMRAAAARRTSTPTASGTSPFRTLVGGLQVLVAALANDARRAGVDIRVSSPVERVDRTGTVILADGTRHACDHVIVASPAHAAAEIVTAHAPGAAREMRDMRWSSSATVVLSYDRSATRSLAGVSGVLVPRVDGEALSAITCASTKWHHVQAHGNHTVLKAYTGHAGDATPVTQLSDDELQARVTRSLARIANIAASPRDVSVHRFDRGIPQYDVGHAARVARIELATTAAFGNRLTLAGASWHGSGIGSVIADGERAARTAVERCTLHSSPTPVPSIHLQRS